MHVKSLGVDSKWMIVGSTNWSRNSQGNNHEMSVLLSGGRETVAEYHRQVMQWREQEVDFSKELAAAAQANRLPASSPERKTALSREPSLAPAADAGASMSSKLQAQFSIALRRKHPQGK